MAERMIEPVADLPAPCYTTPDSETARLTYDTEGDILILLFERGKVATSVDMGEFWLRMDPATGDVYGVEIENFERAFLKRHQELIATWNQAKPFLSHSSVDTKRPLTQQILSTLVGTPWAQVHTTSANDG